MMRAQLSNSDYEHLSAYLDGQLAPGEKRKLEERLQARPELQQALEDLTRTRALLRSAPRRRAPRNFTLTPAMVGQGRQKRGGWFSGLFPTLSFASALATLALVLSLAFELLPNPPGLITAQSEPAPAAMELPAAAPEAGRAMDSADPGMAAEEYEAPAEPAPGLAAESAPADMGPLSEPDPAFKAGEEPMGAPATAMEPLPGSGGGTGGDGFDGAYAPSPERFGMGGGGDMIPYDNKGWAPIWIIPLEGVASLDPESYMRSTQRQRLDHPPSEITGSGPILGVPAPESSGEIQNQSAWGLPLEVISGPPVDRRADNGERADGPDGADGPAPRILGLPALRFTQALLALLAAGLALGAILARRRMTGG